MNRWQSRLLSLFNIQSSEGTLVGLVLAYAILLYAANVLARTAAYALFLTQFNADILPYAYVGISVAVPLVSAVYLRLNQRYPLGKVLLIIHGFLLLTLAAYRIGLGITAAAWLLFSLPIYFGVNNTLTTSSFWNLSGRIFNLQQGKRLFGLLSSGEHIATIVTGFLIPLLVNWLGTANLFLLAGLIMVVTLAVLNHIIQQNAETMGESEAGATADLTSNEPKENTSIFTSPYIRLIIALIALFIIGTYFVDNIFYSQAELRYPDEDALAGFIGIFLGTMGVLSLFIQAFVAGRVLHRLGVRAMILATPVGLLVLMGLFALLGSLGVATAVLFPLVALANLYRLILDAVDSAAANVMYQPLPARQRIQAQTVVMGIVYPLSIGVTGVALLLFTNLLGFTPVMLAYVSLVIFGVWLATGLRLSRTYPQQIQEALAERLFQGTAQLQLDEAALAVVRQSLTSPHVGVVLYALDTVTHNHPEVLVEVLPDLLAHPVAEVRQEALNRIEEIGLVAALTAVRHHIPHEQVPSVRAVALRTLATLDQTSAVDEIEPFLSHYDPQILQGALVGLLRNAGTAVNQEARQRLMTFAQSPQIADRALVAQTICEVGSPDLQPLLASLLSDESLTVRRNALTAAARYPDLWPSVVVALAMPETRAVAAAALIVAGDTAVPLLHQAFTSEQDQEVLWQLARILGRIGTAQAIAFLANHLNLPAHHVRRQILKGLAQAGYQVMGEGRTAVSQQIRAEAKQAAEAMRAVLDLQKDERQDEVALLLNTLQRQIRHHQENIVTLLSFLYEAQTIWRVWAILQPGARAVADQRAYALETIDVIVAKEIKPLLLPFVTHQTLPEQLAQLNAIFPQSSRLRVQRLQDFMESPQPWLQLCAIYGVGQMGLYHEAVVRAVLAVAVAHKDGSLAWQTAVWTLAQLREQVVDQIVADSPETAVVQIMHQIKLRRSGQLQDLPMMAKVDILKRTSLFGETGEEMLTDVAMRLNEVQYAPGAAIFAKGAAGDSMYMIVSGKVRVHDGEHTLNFLATADVFGEMALLDPEPRTASVTAVEPTRLLCLDQEPFRDLLGSQPGLSRGIIRVLSRHLRARVRDLAELRTVTRLAPSLTVTESVKGVGETAVATQLTPIERIILLKRVDLFCNLPNTILTELAMLLHEENIMAAESIFVKGDPGEALYIIAQGEVRVHDGNHTLNYLQEGQVFGEMALLDPEPRLATVTAVTPTHLLRLDQTPFYHLLEEHVEIATPIIHILSTHLRNRMKDLMKLKTNLSN